MAAKKQAPVAETPVPEDVSAPEPTPDAEPAPEPAPAAAPAPPEPVRKYEISRPEPTRCGGYVLTERGWVLDTDQKG